MQPRLLSSFHNQESLPMGVSEVAADCKCVNIQALNQQIISHYHINVDLLVISIYNCY